MTTHEIELKALMLASLDGDAGSYRELLEGKRVMCASNYEFGANRADYRTLAATGSQRMTAHRVERTERDLQCEDKAKMPLPHRG